MVVKLDVEMAAGLVVSELRIAQKRFPKFNSGHEGWAIIAEELDELWDDVKTNRIEDSIEEAVQVAAMAIRYIVDISEVLWLGGYVGELPKSFSKREQMEMVESPSPTPYKRDVT